MEDIRFVDTDGEYLVLESLAGEKFRLIADDRVRAALKRDAAQRLDNVSMSPREIQDAIREGESVAQIAAKSGASLDFVEKIAAPVIAELNHIVDSALTVRLGLNTDKDHPTTEFGDLMNSRLHGLGAADVSWSAKRSDLGIWHLTASYEIDGEPALAVWSFDPKRLALSPENDRAIKLTNNESAQAQVQTPAAFAGNQAPSATPLKVVSSIETETETETDNQTQVLAVVADPAPPVITKRPAMPAPAAEPLSATADLLEALRRKRTERESASAGNQISDSKSADSLSKDNEVPAATENAEVTGSAPKKGRASMPSWDEIVFGTKAED